MSLHKGLLSYKTFDIKKLTIIKFHSNVTRKNRLFNFIYLFYGMTLYKPNALGWDSDCK